MIFFLSNRRPPRSTRTDTLVPYPTLFRSMGIILSFTAAVAGGWADQGLSRLNDLMMSIPTLIFALIVLAVLPQELWILVVVMAVLESTRVLDRKSTRLNSSH